ncbi:MAG: hypothetical protein WCW46_02740 [Candidatus Paceibacterota bacterium]|jgi:hypothetical protein
MVAIFAIILVFGASAFGQAKVYRNNEQIDVTTTNPFGISGGPCWEAVMFTSGFVQNNFQTVQLPNGGFQVTWSTVIHLDNGVGVVSGMAYGVKENFQYVFHFQKGQYVLPQRLFFRLTQTATRKMFMVSQASVLLYDLDTNTTKVMVDKYEVNCP